MTVKKLPANNEAMDAYCNWLGRMTLSGAMLLHYSCPHCDAHLAAEVPPEGRVYDTTSCCPVCSGLFFRVVNNVCQLPFVKLQAIDPARKFTAFVLDEGRDPADPLVLHFEAKSGEAMQKAIEGVYFDHMEQGANVDGFDPEYVSSDSAWSLWCATGAAVLGVLPGHHNIAWNPEGCGIVEYETVYDDAE